MKTDELLKKQLTKRLRRLRERAATLSAEIALVEQLLAQPEANFTNSNFKLRKNSIVKWSIQAQVKSCLAGAVSPIRAQTLLEQLREIDPGLKSSTFRSHLKRMSDAGIIIREGSRGLYRLKQLPSDTSREKDLVPRRRKVMTPGWRFG